MGNELPEDMIKYIPFLEQAAMVTLRAGNYSLSETVLRSILNVVLERQRSDGKRIHKGSFYHNIGFSLVMQKELLNAFRNFLMAYIEDCINLPEREDEADKYPAGRVITKGFVIHQENLSSIKKIVKEKRLTPEKLLEPEDIFRLLLKERGIKETDIESLCFKPFSIDRIQSTLFVSLTGEAAEFLNEIVSKKKEAIIQKAAEIATRRGSKIVTGADIREAKKQLGEIYQ